jgi:TATA-binding protein-associated factor Taf7
MHAIRLWVQGEPQLQLQLKMRTQRVGKLKVNLQGVEESYAVTVHEMPTLVETYKSHNHVNLVKSSDIGQAVLVHNSSNPGSAEEVKNAIHLLMEMEQSGDLPQHIDIGLTPPMTSGCAPSSHVNAVSSSTFRPVWANFAFYVF